MSKWIASFAILGLLVVGGCQNKNDSDSSMRSDEPKRMTTDACSHCPGVQKATADGKCPACGMKV